jgi:hypothetical protein
MKFKYPDKKYKKGFNTIEIFNIYLTNDVHVERHTFCPLYYNKFASILVLIIYYELFNKRYNIRNIINYNQVLHKIIKRLINIKDYYLNGGI